MKKKIVSLVLCFCIVFNCISTAFAKKKMSMISNIWNNSLAKMSVVMGDAALLFFISKEIYNYVNTPKTNCPISRPPENGVFKIILLGGESGEIDNVKRQFNGDKDIMELKNVVLYGSYFQTSPIFEYGDTTARFKIFTTPSILLPGSEERECRIHNIRNSHRNIIFLTQKI